MDKKEFDEQIGRKIKSLRALQNISRKELAEKVGCSTQQIQKYETRINSICPYKLDKIAKIFDVNIGEFFNQDNSDVGFLSYLTKDQSNIISCMIKAFVENNFNKKEE